MTDPVGTTSGRRGNAVVSGLLLGSAGAILFAGKAVIVKLAYRHGIDPVTLIGLRMLYSAPLFALVAWWMDGRPRRVREPYGPGGPGQPGTRFAWRRSDIGRLIGLGLSGYYLASLLDFFALQYISVGLERVILYLNPTFVLLIGFLWFRRPVNRRQLSALLVSYIGVVLVFIHDVDASGQHVVLGSLLVLASGLVYAVYLSVAGEMVSRLGSLRLTAWASLVACAACVIHALIATGDAMWRAVWQVQLLSLVNGVFCTVLPVFMLMMAVERLGSARASQTGMIGPASTIMLGAVVLDEPIGWLQMVGTAVVIVGVLMLTRVPPPRLERPQRN